MKSYSQRLLNFFLLILITLVLSFQLLGVAPVNAGIDDDRFDGNIYVVYAGNGSLVPSKVGLADALHSQTPVILVYYLDDSRDCKQFAIVVSRMQEFYGKAAIIIPVNVDGIPFKNSYAPNETGYYYNNVVPQTVILDQKGKTVYNGKGIVPFEEVDDVLRKVFNLVPRTESTTLKRRSFNEFNTELVPQ
ncbi:thioredoxin family protein [Aphanothece hegewaldii CCALA 016]|uniref:Thioredoxin family protein n=1 Tax=Aphanothece hegewaldii CCALA 016 TaxID=2107694 RepID=A0A2T1LTT7_9CHRO|nr:thylakoid membrane photosystem I accumulation factor [Aphanothece hegewaldii]PSF34237.1 thioredoxin family protein [Aphanothece hegewaldii CCALA 016]